MATTSEIFRTMLASGALVLAGNALFAAEEAPAPPKPSGVVVELEDGEFEDAEAASEHDGFTGTGFANFERFKGASVEVTATLEKAGSYAMVIRFANGSFEHRPLQILVNGKVAVERLVFKGTEDEMWDLYRTISTDKIAFNAGKNTIKFVCIDEDGPNLDNVTIVTEPLPEKPKEGEGKE